MSLREVYLARRWYYDDSEIIGVYGSERAAIEAVRRRAFNHDGWQEGAVQKFDRTSASLFIDVVVKRTAAHQSTIKQAMLLVSKGIPADVAKTMTFARASAAMTELAMTNWRPTPGWIEKYRQPEREVAA